MFEAWETENKDAKQSTPWHDELPGAFNEAADRSKAKEPDQAAAKVLGNLELFGADKADQSITALEIAEKLLKAITAAYLLKVAMATVNDRGSSTRDTSPTRRMYLGDKAVESGKYSMNGEGEFVRGGKGGAQLEISPDGKASVQITDTKLTAYIRDAEGKVRPINAESGKVELKMGDSIGSSNGEFRTLATTDVAPYRLKLVAAGPIEPIQGEVKISLEPGKSYELGRGNAERPVVKENGTVRYEMAAFGLSGTHARFGVDAGGIFVIDGQQVNNLEVRGSTNGTYVNGKLLEPGAKQYLSTTDKVSLGKPGGALSVDVKFEPANLEQAPHSVPQKLAGQPVTVLRNEKTGSSIEIGSGREVIVGTKGHVDPGGKFLQDQHAKIRVDANGNAFIKVKDQPGAAEQPSAYIERANGQNQQIKAQDGWVPIGKGDKVSAGGSPLFDVFTELRSSTTARLAGKDVHLKPGDTVEIGRGAADESFDPKQRIELDKAHVSRTHAELGVDEKGRMFVKDIGSDGKGSTNGTFVNGHRIEPNQRTYITFTDQVWLGAPEHPKSERLDLAKAEFAGNPSFNAEARLPDPAKKPVRLVPREQPQSPSPAAERGALPAASAAKDPTSPADLRGSIKVGFVDGRNVRILGGLGDFLPHESIKLTSAERSSLGSQGSAYSPVTLFIRGQEVTYYRPRENPNRFYLLSENGREGPKLIRDYEVFVEPGGNQDRPEGAKNPKPNPSEDDNGGKPKPENEDKGPKPESPAEEASRKLSGELPQNFSNEDIKSKLEEMIAREKVNGGGTRFLQELEKLQKLAENPIECQKLAEALKKTRTNLASASLPQTPAVVSGERLADVGSSTGSIRDGVAVATPDQTSSLPKEAVSEIDTKQNDLDQKLKDLEQKLEKTPGDKALEQQAKEVRDQMRALETAKNTPSGRARVAEWCKRNTGKGLGTGALVVFIFATFMPHGQSSDRVGHATIK